jgi:dCTP deaminase
LSRAGRPCDARILEHDPAPAKVYANEGACQFLFLQGNEPCEVSYADRAGKYMGQKGVTLPKL